MATVVTAGDVALSDLEAAVEQAWTRATSADSANWREENTAWGQCAVTALVVQDYLGGDLRRGEVGPFSHYWNVLPAGDDLDLTRHQFGDDVQIANIEPRTREYLLSNPDTARRYRQLAGAVRAYLRRSLRNG